MTPEARVAKVFRETVVRRGGFAFKVSGMGRRGLPDYVVVSKGVVSFVELKTEHGRTTELQERTIETLREHGARVFVAYGEAQAKRLAAACCG